MRRYEYDPATQEGWKSYPIRLTIQQGSRCHSKPQILVQSMEGGFVAVNCVECGQKENLTEDAFRNLLLLVACPDCRRAMSAGLVPDKSGQERNYGYRCKACEVYVWLADLLPHWKDAT